MLKHIEINYPEFWLELNEKLTKGINIIQWANGYWKTTIINTIHSMMTGKYPWSRNNPKWFAKIDTDVNPNTLTNGKWLWTYPSDPMISYAFPWKFFEIKTTTEQRKILIELLGIDHEEFMQKEFSNLWIEYDLLLHNTEKELKSQLKDTQAMESVMLDDIMKYKTFIKEFKDEDFDDVIYYLKNKDLVLDKIHEYNSNDPSVDIKREINDNLSKIKFAEDKLAVCKKAYLDLKNTTTCPTCKHKIEEAPTEALAKLKAEWEVYIAQADTLKLNNSRLKWDISQKDFKKLWTQGHELWESVKVLKIESFKEVTQSRLDQYDEYKHQMSKVSIYRDDLKEKTEQLKKLNTEVIKDCLVKLWEVKVKFTEHLNDKTKDLPLQIELFKTQKNWELKETFDIIDDWVSYNNLSTGKRMIVQIKLAEIFANKYHVDTICIDEWGTISKDNLSYIKELAKTKQVIICKATSWSKADLKST